MTKSNPVRLTHGNALAVGIMPLLVQQSFVRDPTQGPNSKNVYRITGLPFSQDIRWDLSLWGLKLGFTDIRGPVGALGISFQSRYQSTTPPPGRFPLVSAVYLPDPYFLTAKAGQSNHVYTCNQPGPPATPSKSKTCRGVNPMGIPTSHTPATFLYQSWAYEDRTSK